MTSNRHQARRSRHRMLAAIDNPDDRRSSPVVLASTFTGKRARSRKGHVRKIQYRYRTALTRPQHSTCIDARKHSKSSLTAASHTALPSRLMAAATRYHRSAEVPLNQRHYKICNCLCPQASIAHVAMLRHSKQSGLAKVSLGPSDETTRHFRPDDASIKLRQRSSAQVLSCVAD